MAGRHWSEIDQESWDNIEIYISEDTGQFSVEFDYTGRNNQDYHYPREKISFDDFLDIYDEAIELDQDVEVGYG